MSTAVEMKAKVNLDPLWGEIESQRGERLTIREVAQKSELDDRTVINARRKSNKVTPTTLAKLRCFFQSELGRTIWIDDLLEVTDDDD
jgi:hypothetical protein